MKKTVFASFMMFNLLFGTVLSSSTNEDPRNAIVVESLKKCFTCHGKDFEKQALGKSKVVKDMNSIVIFESLKGYQEGKGGPLKGVMKGQVVKYNDKDLKIIADTIGKK
jgi:cytochrome c-type protein NapB